MRTIEETKQFRSGYKLLLRQSHSGRTESAFSEVLSLLIADLPLQPKHRDHAMKGAWTGFRDCHVLPDVVLIYRKVGDTELHLVRIGSHSALKL